MPSEPPKNPAKKIEAGDGGESPLLVQIPFAEKMRLEQEAMLSKLEVELSERLKKRFTLLLVAVAVTSFFGIQGLASVFINQQLGPQVDKAREATAKATAEADLASRRSQEALTLAQDQAQRVSALLDPLDKRAEQLEARITSVGASSENVRSQLEASVMELETRLALITSQVPSAAVQSDVATALAGFTENSDYEIAIYVRGVSPTPKAEDLVGKLRALGFRVSFEQRGTSQNETNRATVDYTPKGLQKLDLVTDAFEASGLEVAGLELNMPGLDSILVGDIQINFQDVR